MGIAKREDDPSALHIRFVTYTHYIHLPTESLCNSDHGIVRQRPSQTMQGRLIIRTACCSQFVTFKLKADTLRNWGSQRTFRPFHFKLALMDCDADAFR